MKHRNYLIIIIISILCVPLYAAPGLINYQGRLTDNLGAPITSSVNITFTFWDAETGGNQLGTGFSDTDSVLPDSNGIYTTLIGDDPGNLVPESIFSGNAVWLNINVNSEDLVPRMRITSVGYAINSDTIDGKHASDFATAAGVEKVIRDYVVDAGQTISAGDIVSYINGKIRKYSKSGSTTVYNSSSGYVSAAALSDSKFVIAYQDLGNSSYGTAIIGTLSGSTISFGSEYVFNTATTSYISLKALSDTKFAISYSDSGNSNYGTAIIGTVSDTTISFGSEYVFRSAATNFNILTALSDSKIVITYKKLVGPNEKPISIVGTVSGTTISFGAEYNCASDIGSTDPFAVNALSDSKIVVAYQNTSGIVIAVIGDISGTTITFGSNNTLQNGYSNYIDVKALSASKFVAGFMDTSNGNYSCIIGEVSGTTVSNGPKNGFYNGFSLGLSIAVFSSSKFAVLYDDYATHSVMLGTVIGKTISYDSTDILNIAAGSVYPIIKISNNQYIIPFSDANNSYNETVLLNNFATPLGAADAAATSGQSCAVILKGVSDHYTGLDVGNRYYINPDGSLTTSATNTIIGAAISDTEILLDIER